MAVYGDLQSMPCPELLQWLGSALRSGVLEVERDRICKRLVFREGRVIAASSNDPRELLGHFLVSRGQITEELLRIALDQQERQRHPLGETLTEMGVLTRDELLRNLASQAEEILFSLFDWSGGVFRFHDDEAVPVAPFPLDIRVEDILLKGAQRRDEIGRIREVIADLATVPDRTDKLPPPEVFRNRVARRIYESIDGKRTVADIILHAHGSEFAVTRFLFEAHLAGLVRVPSSPRPAPTPKAPEPASPAPTPASTGAPSTPSERSGNDEREAREPIASAPSTSSPPPAETPPAPPTSPAGIAPEPPEVTSAIEFERRLLLVRKAMSDGNFVSALETLDELYRDRPNDDALRRLHAEAEAAFIDKAWKHYLPGDAVLTLERSLDDLRTENLTPQEMFLLSRIDGAWSVKAIVQIAPIREVDALRVLKRLVDGGLVGLRMANVG